MENNPYESPTTPNHPTEPQPPTKGMTAPEVFGAVARGIGLYFLCVGVVDLAVCVIPHDGPFDTSRYLHGAIEYFAAGVIPFFAPDFLVKLTYRTRKPSQES